MIKFESDKVIGQTINHYRLTGLLGKGGMGVVYQGLDINLNRQVAIKVMHDKLARHRSFRQQFLKEAQAAARLDHPHIVPIFHFGAHEQYLYMVMGLVTGGSLGSFIRSTSVSGHLIDLHESLAIVAQIAEALEHAHAHGIVHRDVKPDNVLLRALDAADQPADPPLRALVSDFGLARVAAEEYDLYSHIQMGTLPYISPEQFDSHEIDGRADLYGLGMVFYQLVTGRLPFKIETRAEAVTHHLSTPVPDPGRFNPALPPAVARLILKSLKKKPEERFQTAQAMAAAIREVDLELRRQRPEGVHQHSRFAPGINFQENGRSGWQGQNKGPVDTLIIREKTGRSYFFKLTKKSFTLGRSRSCDIILPGVGTSREHAHLRWEGPGWVLTDLASTNGTFLAGRRLGAHQPEKWAAGQFVQIGSIFIEWQSGELDESLLLSTAAYHQPTGHENGRHITQAEWPNRHILEHTGEAINHHFEKPVVLRPAEVIVEPGQRLPVQLHIFNNTESGQRLLLTVDGLPNEWFTIIESEIVLSGRSVGTMTVAFHPPRIPSARAGDYPFTCCLAAESVGEQSDLSEPVQKSYPAVDSILTVRAYPAFEVELSPSTLRHGQKGVIAIHNLGNAPDTFTLSGQDQTGFILFNIEEENVVVQPEERYHVPVQVWRAKRPWLGRAKINPILFQISNQAIGQKVEGKCVTPAIISTWAWIVLFSLLTAAVVGSMIYFS